MEEFTEGKIVEENGLWVIYSNDGKKLGSEHTEQLARKKLREINYFREHIAIKGHFLTKENPNDPKNVPAEAANLSAEEMKQALDKNLLGEV
jgi:hypothetical protein